ncbi:MAG: GNAT family N-acetyltransferase [Chlorobiaceae bacterium]|nr:GNAT family N-acetyltransferase [Chlorobiaceae bacterium]
MNTHFTIRRAMAEDASPVAGMVDELLTEIMETIGEQAFDVSPARTAALLRDFLDAGRYIVFVAFSGDSKPAGFIALCESCSLYAGGVYGTIPEFYVRPGFRSSGLGQALLAEAKRFGESLGWTRLEVATPPLPEFERTVAFYEREGFSVTGGRKMKVPL